MKDISGSCLCGAVTYFAKADPVMIAVCHCTDCQKQSGSPFSVNVLVPNEQVEMQGESLSQFTKQGASGEKVTRNFCNRCGSPLSSVFDHFGGLAAIKSGTLHDSSWVKPTIQIWCNSRQPWSTLDERLQKAAENPE